MFKILTLLQAVETTKQRWQPPRRSSPKNMQDYDLKQNYNDQSSKMEEEERKMTNLC